MGEAALPERQDAVPASLLSRAAHVADAGRRAVIRGGRRAAEGAARGEWAYHALTSTAPPTVPVTVPWVLSVGALLGRHPRTPPLVHKALGLLDGFGAIRLGPGAVGFDGEEIPWEKVVEVRTRNAFEVMTTQALEHEVDRIRQFLPPVPGRKWLVTRAAEALATVVLAALEHGSFDRPLDQVEVPAEIVHRGLLSRQRILTGGLFAVAGLVVVEQAAESLAATAALHGVPVTPGPRLADVQPDRADRVGMLRDRTDAMAEFLARLQRDADAADPAGPDPGSVGSASAEPVCAGHVGAEGITAEHVVGAEPAGAGPAAVGTPGAAGGGAASFGVEPVGSRVAPVDPRTTWAG